MNIRILPSAVKDLARGSRFYERQGEGLGHYFLDSLYSDIDSLAPHAGISLKVGKYHGLLSKRFPYAIYCRVADAGVEVWRVPDCRRDPRKLRPALR